MPYSVKSGNEDRKAEAFIAGAAMKAAPVRAATASSGDADAGKTTISLRFDTRVLTRIDAAAKRLGISRTAWLHLAAGELLEVRR
jgi:hypothetical protein